MFETNDNKTEFEVFERFGWLSVTTVKLAVQLNIEKIKIKNIAQIHDFFLCI